MPCRSDRFLIKTRSTHQLINLDDGQQDREHDQQYDCSHDENHQRFEQRQEYRESTLQRLGFEMRRTFEHLFELAAEFPARHQMYQQWRKGAGCAKRPRQAGTFPQSLDGGLDGFPHDHVRHDPGAGGERREQ